MRVFTALCLCLLACGPGVEVAGVDESTSTGARLTASASLLFRDDYSVSPSAALMVGGEARLEYDARRVQRCTGDFNGQPGWSTTAHYTINGGAQKMLTVAGFFPSGAKPAVIPLDVVGTLEVWFETTSRWGCQEWDSNFGNNYRFEIFSPSTVHFKADRTITLSGSLHEARAIALDFDLSRLPNCRQTYSGLPSWEILAYAQFDGAPLQTVTVTRMDGGTRLPSNGVLAVPAGSHSVEVWFLNSDRGGCHEYDSDYGRNYLFEL